MTYEDAVKSIVENWERLHEKQNPKDKYTGSKPKMVAVWCATSDQADSYEVDEEWVGITPQGNVAWAYASGCSCWDGDFSEEHVATLKELTLDHKHSGEEWEAAIIKFAETEEMQQLGKYNRYG